ncbi:ETX/MTX2 family pore-forming toxin [Pseudodesulfovibrio sp.]|uniref:ETX/MTX2 family pore-forming toxin n=1 Tax=unclassified Pseudodesulfovibrio TaxID=2661612 RepID=UPI003B00D676
MGEFYFHIMSKAFDDCGIVAGDKADGHVYLQKPEGRQNAEWLLEPTDDGFYYIVDRLHGKYLCAGEKADNHLYHQDNKKRAVAKWAVERKMLNGNVCVLIRDLCHSFAVTSCEKFDGKVYHQSYDAAEGQDPTESHVAALWELIPADANAKSDDLPDIYWQLYGEVKMVTVKAESRWEKAQAVPLMAASKGVDNSSDIVVDKIVELKYAHKREADIEFSHETSLAQAVGVAGKVGFDLNLGDKDTCSKLSLAAKGSYSRSWTDTARTSKSYTTSYDYEYTDTTKVPVPPHSSVHVKLLLVQQMTNIPFDVEMELDWKNGTRIKKTTSGSWKGILSTDSTTEVE